MLQIAAYSSSGREASLSHPHAADEWVSRLDLVNTAFCSELHTVEPMWNSQNGTLHGRLIGCSLSTRSMVKQIHSMIYHSFFLSFFLSPSSSLLFFSDSRSSVQEYFLSHKTEKLLDLVEYRLFEKI